MQFNSSGGEGKQTQTHTHTIQYILFVMALLHSTSLKQIFICFPKKYISMGSVIPHGTFKRPVTEKGHPTVSVA
jgi:hypothetical protein